MSGRAHRILPSHRPSYLALSQATVLENSLAGFAPRVRIPAGGALDFVTLGFILVKRESIVFIFSYGAQPANGWAPDL
jgi:hypothetical protein